MSRKTKDRSEWKMVERLAPKGKFTDVYSLKRTNDDSLWYAYKAEEHDKFLSDMLSIVERMETNLNKFGQSANIHSAPNREESLYCTNCGSKEIVGHNYCGKCGQRLPSSQ